MTAGGAGLTASPKKFRVFLDSMAPSEDPAENRRRTVMGRSDNTQGGIVRSWSMIFKIRNTTTGTDPDGSTYGVLDDLRTWYHYRNINATPSNQFTLTDHSGSTFVVEFVGPFAERFITPTVSGSNAWFSIPVVLERVD